MSVYTRKDKHIKVEGKGGGSWVRIGGRIAATYLPPQMNHHELARALGAMGQVDTIIGDLNECGRSKKKRLEQFTQEEQLDDIGREEHTHEWGDTNAQ